MTSLRSSTHTTGQTSLRMRLRELDHELLGRAGITNSALAVGIPQISTLDLDLHSGKFPMLRRPLTSKRVFGDEVFIKLRWDENNHPARARFLEGMSIVFDIGNEICDGLEGRHG